MTQAHKTASEIVGSFIARRIDGTEAAARIVERQHEVELASRLIAGKNAQRNARYADLLAALDAEVAHRFFQATR